MSTKLLYDINESDCRVIHDTLCRICHQSCTATAVNEELGRYECSECGSTYEITVTDHAREERWNQYTDEPTTDKRILRAWGNARPLPEDARDWNTTSIENVDRDRIVGHRWVGTQLRYHRDSNTVLLLRDGTIVTVSDVPSARYDCKIAILQSYTDTMSAEELIALATDIGLGIDAVHEAIRREKIRAAVTQKLT